MIQVTLKALSFFSLSVLAYWALFGIFNDNVVVFKFLNFAGQVIPYVALTILLLLLLLLKQIKWRVGVALLALPSLVIPFYVINLSLYHSPQDISEHTTTESFSFITFSKMSHNTNYAEVAKVIDCEKYDVINVQEIRDLKDFLAEFPSIETKCNVAINEKNSQLVIFSKFKMNQKKLNGIGVTELHIRDKERVILINVHAIKAITSTADSQNTMVSNFIKLAKKNEQPIIIAGDFNATHFNQSIYQMKSNFEYAKPDSKLLGNSATWPGESRRLGIIGPWIQIDYIFYKGFSTKNTIIHNSSYGSDHYPLETYFTFPQGHKVHE